ncbi:Mss4-like protein [Chaetomidium leptoderma]|uniref:Peptide-methionine (R)-S-oxide reductase n=1 Tax=Chaetomidium leptoderma TaxID=669021 RepID=A0AAN6ZXR9_9PEZI|nr:Mss4-like protein [Chaetomidium leptoderma]
MRSRLFRILPTLSNLIRLPTFRTAPRPLNTTTLKSMPSIPFLSALFGGLSTNTKNTMTSSYPDQRTEDEWRAVLSPEQFRVLREQGTEQPNTGTYNKHAPTSGVYTCAGCKAPLYTAQHKFASGCGWPAYFDSIPGAVVRHEDSSLGMLRVEIVCANCGGHLGHVFRGEGFPTPIDERHCVNSVSLSFVEGDGEGRKEKGGEGEGKGESK